MKNAPKSDRKEQMKATKGKWGFCGPYYRMVVPKALAMGFISIHFIVWLLCLKLITPFFLEYFKLIMSCFLEHYQLS